MVEAFDIADVNANPARFDPKKCEAINATHIRMLAPDDFAARLTAQVLTGGLDADPRVIAEAAPLVQERIKTLGQGAAMLRFLLVPEAEFSVDEAAVAKQLGDAGQQVLAAAVPALEALPEWAAAAIEAALKGDPGRRPRAQAAQRVRTAAGRGHRQHRLAAAVRVDGDPRPGALARPDAARAAPGLSGAVGAPRCVR